MSFFIPRKKLSPSTTASEQTLQHRSRSGVGSSDDGEGTSIRKATESNSSSVINFYPAWCNCSPWLPKKELRKGESPPCCVRWKNAFLCPPSGILSRFLYFVFANALFWLVMWGLDRHLAIDTISALICLEILGLSFGVFMKLIGLPALLAPLIIGIILNNHQIHNFDFFSGLHARHWIHPIREIALTIILTRAGVELSPKQLMKLKGIVPLAAFGPCLVEALTCTGLFYLFFHIYRREEIPLAMCFVAGFALAAVSPAVVVPSVLTLQKKKYGVKHGIPTLLIAASSIDDVLAISAYSISLSMMDGPGDDAKDHRWKTYAGPPLGITVGLVHGLIVGVFLHFIPSKDMGHQRVPYFRVSILLLFNVACMLGYQWHYLKWLSGAGSVGVLMTSFIASFGWRSVPHWKAPMKKIEVVLAHIWTLFVPMLFGTIGTEIVIKDFNWKIVGTMVGIIFICLLIRCLTMFTIVCCVKTNMKERLFCALSWIPKATVQAALAPLAASKFDMGLEGRAPLTPQEKLIDHLHGHAKNVVLLAVLAILITAPLGAILISLTGPKLLTRDEGEEIHDGFPNGDGEPDEVKEIKIPDSTYDNVESTDMLDVNMEPGLIELQYPKKLQTSSGTKEETSH